MQGKIYKTISLQNLFVDHSYQRPLGLSRVKRLAANDTFNELQVQIPHVNRRTDGRYAVVDGQHTIAILATRNIQNIDVLEFSPSLSYEDEARMFHLLNAQPVAVKAYYGYNARKEAGDKVILEIERVLAANGLHVVSGGDQGCVPDAVCCVTELEKTYARAGVAGLGIALSTLKNAWGSNSKSFKRAWLAGMARLYHTYKHTIDYARLSAVLRKMGQTELEQDVKSRSRLDSADRSVVTAEVMLLAYNKGLRDTKIEIGQLRIRSHKSN